METSRVAATMLRRRLAALARKSQLHNSGLKAREIDQLQAARFNDVWQRCTTTVPFYRSWQREHNLPSAISSVEEVAEFPSLTKGTLVARAAEIFEGLDPKRAYVTGGSTGAPARFPAARRETVDFWANTYLARQWAGLAPLEPGVLLWGHAHLFGDGLAAQVARRKRQLSDRLFNMTRLDAYDLSDNALARARQAIITRTPAYLLGYTSAVFRLARYIELVESLPGPLNNLRTVVLTAETVTDADVATISKVFGAHVSIEYGMAETGVIAASAAPGRPRPLNVIWDSFVVNVDSTGSINVTTLDNRAFPLINYETGDASVNDRGVANALSLTGIRGRAKDSVWVRERDGSLLELSAILPVHILKQIPEIIGVQFRQGDAGQLTILLQSRSDLSRVDVHQFFHRQLTKDHPDFDSDSVTFERAASPVLSRSGKQALVVE